MPVLRDCGGAVNQHGPRVSGGVAGLFQGLEKGSQHRAAAIENVSTLKQNIVFRFDRFEIGLFAEHKPHLDLDSPRDKRDRDIVGAPFEWI